MVADKGGELNWLLELHCSTPGCLQTVSSWHVIDAQRQMFSETTSGMKWLKTPAVVVPASLCVGILAFTAAMVIEVSISAVLGVPFRAEFWAIPNMAVAGIASALGLRFFRKRLLTNRTDTPQTDGINSRAARRRAQRAATAKAPLAKK